MLKSNNENWELKEYRLGDLDIKINYLKKHFDIFEYHGLQEKIIESMAVMMPIQDHMYTSPRQYQDAKKTCIYRILQDAKITQINSLAKCHG